MSGAEGGACPERSGATARTGLRRMAGLSRTAGSLLGLACVLAVVLLAGNALRAGADGPETASSIEIIAKPVDVRASHLDGLTPLGAWELSSPAPGFGGLSGLVAEDGKLRAVTDKGAILEAEIALDDGRLTIGAGRMTPMRSADGSWPGKAGGDAEALALVNGTLWAAFENDHRIARLDPDGTIRDPIRPGAFERLPSNKGIEGLAVAGDTLLAIPEAWKGDGFAVFALSPDGTLLGEGHIEAPRPHRATGADVGPDGKLYVVFRDFSLMRGVSIHLRRYRLAGSPPLPVRGTGETLATWPRFSGIDNMESVALWRGPDGRTRLWLLSDDNFNLFQRTLLMAFEVNG